jgi:hypothetical protein
VPDLLHTGQRNILQRAKRFNTVACGRRFGKTTLGLAIAYSGAPGSPGALRDGLDVGWFAHGYKLLDEAWRQSLLFLKPMIRRTDKQQRRIELVTGGALDFWTLENIDAGRGRKYGVAIVDEAGLSRTLEGTWDAAIRPTLTDKKGGAWFLGTPKGRNFFWALSQRAAIKPEIWAHHTAPSAANPHIDPEEIEQAREDMPESIFQQEYLAAFLESGGGVFRNVTAAIDHTLSADPFAACMLMDGRAYLISVDWARHEDFTVLTVFDAKARAVVSCQRFNETDYITQLARLTELHRRFPAAPIVCESNNMGEPLIEILLNAGLPVTPFMTTAQSKADIIQTLQLAFERKEIRLPAIGWLLSEFMAFEQLRRPGGGISYSAPPGGHDDGVMSVAIGWSRLFEALPKVMGARLKNL